MRHINKLLVSVTLILVISSCNQDFHPVGEALFIDQTLETLTESFPTFTFQEKLKKVQTNGLPLMQLGKINHPIFGQAEASFTAQLTIPNNLFLSEIDPIAQHVKQCLAHPVGGGAQMRCGIARANLSQAQTAVLTGDDPHPRSRALRSLLGSAARAGSTVLPASIRRLATI